MIETLFDSFLAADLSSQIMVGAGAATGACILFGGLKTLWKIALPIRWTAGKAFRGVGNAFHKVDPATTEVEPTIIYKEAPKPFSVEDHLNFGNREEMIESISFFENNGKENRDLLSDDQLADLISLSYHLELDRYDFEYLRNNQSARKAEVAAKKFLADREKERQLEVEYQEKAAKKKQEKQDKAKLSELLKTYGTVDTVSSTLTQQMLNNMDAMAGQSNPYSQSPWKEVYPGAFKA